MSDPNDRSTRPPSPRAGASGSPGSIGKALGSDLDFEPDALLDSLTESAAPPPADPDASESQPPHPEPRVEDKETVRPSYPDEEVTVVGPREMFAGMMSAVPTAPAPPSLPNFGRGPDSRMATPLLERPLPVIHEAPARIAPGLRPPPAIPRPAAGAPPLPPRPGSKVSSSMPTVNPPFPTPLPEPGAQPLEEIDAVALDDAGSTRPPPAPPDDPSWSEPPDSRRTSLTADEIAALDELESLSPPATAPASAPAVRRIAPAPGPLPVISSRPPAAPAIASRPPPHSDAGPTLPRPGEADEWAVRAEWMESEARSIPDAQARSRALVVASEIWALAGNLERARKTAQDASTAGRSTMAGRQLRWLAAASGDWKTVASTLELELRSASTAEARAHAAYLDAEVHRLCLADEAAANKRLELALAADPDEPRSHVAQIAQALAATAGAPDLELPERPAELANAVEEASRLRAAEGDPLGQGSLAAFAIARRALSEGNSARTARALEEVGKVTGLASATRWLRAALLAHAPETRAQAAAALETELRGPDAVSARRALAARALELSDGMLLATALEESDDAFTPADRLVLRALIDREGTDFDGLAEEVTDAALAPLAAAVLASAGGATPECGNEAGRAAAALGRTLVQAKGDLRLEALEGALTRFTSAFPAGARSRLLQLELDSARGRAAEVAETLGNFGALGGEAPAARDRALAKGLLLELAGDVEEAHATYADAWAADPSFEAALRPRLATLEADGKAAGALLELADAAGDPVHAALALVESVLRGGGDDDGARRDERLKRAVSLEPALSLGYRIGEQDARAAGDVDRLVDWLRARREVTPDDVERALDLVREALLVADTAPNDAVELLEQAISAHPGDIGLRELLERMSPGAVGAERGAWRETAAEHASPETRALLLLQAALEYERAGDREGAARTARLAAESGGALAELLAHRTSTGTPEAARIAEALLAKARAATDPNEQRELYEELSELDRERGDTASVLLWQKAILEQAPDALPALRQLERAHAGSDQQEALETVATTLSRVLPDAEGVAHARLAARLRLRAGAWAARRELAELAAAREPNSIWALRALAAHARAADEPEKALDAYQRLFAIAPQELDKAALALRAAEAAARLGRFEEAKTLLEACIERVPDHIVALTKLSEVLEALRDFPGAARALEVAAEASRVTAHRVEAWHQAAVVWLDRVGDAERGRAALEQALALDSTHEDAIARLQQLLIDAGDRQALATLLERRIALAGDAEERVALEVQRGKLLAGAGEHAAAKAALTAALDANPDHAGALEALAEVSTGEGDWPGAEQALIRLVRHTPEPARQAQIYRKLGELYDVNLPNLERAELAYREVLKREPDDLASVERLTQVLAKLGQTDRAVELQSELLERATSREQKRDRMLSLAVVFEQVVKDKKRADATFERARKEWPQDVAVMRAVVEYHRRAGEQRAAQVILDRAATDARRALSTGRFEPAQFEMLGTVAELRGHADLALVAEATLEALAGRPVPVRGAGLAAAKTELDELLAPELVTPALQNLLRQSGDVLDTAYPLDLRPLRAGPVPAEAREFEGQAHELAAGLGIQKLEVLVSPALGATCLATRSTPAQLVYGSALLEKADDATRYFLLLRALKLVQARAATLARTVPAELGPMIAGYLSALADYTPEGIDAKRLLEAQKRIKAAIVRPYQGDVPTLALEVVGSLGNRVSQLSTALNQWAARSALLAVGSPLTAIRALALTATGGIPADGPERLRWIARHPEARDLAIFSVSEQYTELRRRLGLSG